MTDPNLITAVDRAATVPRPLLMSIGGDRVASSSGETLTSVNPTTEDVIATFPAATPLDVDAAVEAARSAARPWARLGWSGRAKLLREFAQAILDERDRFARLDVVDAGLPLSAMLSDVDQAVEEVRFFAGIASQARGSTPPSSETSVTYTSREPYGVVGRIVPFNHPLKFALGRIAAPLAAGNTVVLKPGEHTSLSALELGYLAEQILPAGVLNVVTGTGAGVGSRLVEHPSVPRIAFTGSVETGRAVLRSAAAGIKHVTLELGGKNPVIVFPDVEVDLAVLNVLGGANISRANGQSCGSGTRVYVHRDIFAAFVEKLKRAVEELVVGDPLQPGVEVGPLAFAAHRDRVLGLIDIARQEGATVLTGGGQPANFQKGFFVEPTVLADLNDSMTIVQTEVFGPVISVLEWTEVDDVIARANSLPLGLTASIWTKDINAALRTAAAVESGYVSVNGDGRRVSSMPFGGWKLSGLGQENGLEELYSYTREKVTTVTLH